MDKERTRMIVKDENKIHGAVLIGTTVLSIGHRCLFGCVKIWSHTLIIGASLSEPHTGSSRFNRGTVVTFPKVYATNTESPTLSVVYSTVVRWSRSRKFTLVARKDWPRTWHVRELKVHAEERE